MDNILVMLWMKCRSSAKFPPLPGAVAAGAHPVGGGHYGQQPEWLGGHCARSGRAGGRGGDIHPPKGPASRFAPGFQGAKSGAFPDAMSL